MNELGCAGSSVHCRVTATDGMPQQVRGYYTVDIRQTVKTYRRGSPNKAPNVRESGGGWNPSQQPGRTCHGRHKACDGFASR